MSFALEIKFELLEQNLNKKFLKFFLMGVFLTVSNQVQKSFLNLSLKDLLIKQKKLDLVKNFQAKDIFNFFMSVEEKDYLFENLQKYLKVFFGGLFVGGGSISKLDSNWYHLEIAFYKIENALITQELLNKAKFNFQMIKRRNKHVLYLKKADQIADFLKVMQTFKSLLKFEDQRIERDYYNHLNRYSILDTYNLNKMARANVKFMTIFEKAKKENGQYHFLPKIWNFFELKYHNPYLSLNELIDLYQKKFSQKISKSGANHWLIKLRKQYDDV